MVLVTTVKCGATLHHFLATYRHFLDNNTQLVVHLYDLLSLISDRGVYPKVECITIFITLSRQFALVLNTFLDHLDRGTWPQALPARIRLRYTLLAQAQDLERQQRLGASS
jgi:hypothetical protein